MFAAQATVEGASVLDLCLELQWEGAGFVESKGVHIGLSVAAEQCLEPAVVGAAFPHVNDIAFEEDLGVYELLAFWA